jgi:hypothetical protein
MLAATSAATPAVMWTTVPPASNLGDDGTCLVA